MPWFDESPAPILQWVFGLAGVVALVGVLIAVPTVAQMIWGRPLIKVDPSKTTVDNCDILEFHIYNDPKVRWLPKWLWVNRETEPEIVSDIAIRYHGTDQVVADLILPTLARRGTGEPGAQRVPLPPSGLGVSCIVALQNPEQHGEVSIGARGAWQSISPGQYSARIRVIGRKTIIFRRSFMVNPDGSIYWLSN